MTVWVDASARSSCGRSVVTPDPGPHLRYSVNRVSFQEKPIMSVHGDDSIAADNPQGQLGDGVRLPARVPGPVEVVRPGGFSLHPESAC